MNEKIILVWTSILLVVVSLILLVYNLVKEAEKQGITMSGFKSDFSKHTSSFDIHKGGNTNFHMADFVIVEYEDINTGEIHRVIECR